MTVNLPEISVLIPTFNEQNFIEDCILSLIKSNYPDTLLQIIVIDGQSTDNTRSIVNYMGKSHDCLELIENKKRIVPAALNLGIEAARHEIIVWVGAHAIYEPDYLVNSVRVLLEENCASVGGVITPISKSKMGQAIADATSSKFGIGNARYRHANKRQAVDTVFGGCWKKSNILKVEGFNEAWVRNQDFELNHRLRTEIGPIILDPSIRCNYYCRDSIKALASQYFNYGYWRFHTALKHPKTMSIRQFAPLALLLGFMFSLLVSLIDIKTSSIIPGIYLTSSIAVGAGLALKHQKPGYLVLMPIIFATLHFSWAFGFSKSALVHVRQTLSSSQA